ncbi:hypothetical protein [Streptomyces sp. NPDC013740]|uniref:hypothetical protein n=1 Tax=Streptomyces sp. NPDC013740 TaxID=3364867 RepID=UPI0036F912DF
MGESVQVRCPECLRTQRYAAPAFPCLCGVPIAPPLAPDATAEPVTHRNGADEWVTVRCPACARTSDWPHPELGCACGTVLRVPVRGAGTGGLPGPDEPPAGPGHGAGARAGAGGAAGAGAGAGSGAAPEVLPDAEAERGASGDPDRDAERDRDREAGWGTGVEMGWGADLERGLATGLHTAPAPDGLPRIDRGIDRDLDPDGYPSFTQRHPSPPPPRLPAPPHSSRAHTSARPSFRPVTIRTARDAVAASAGYLRWLGFRDVVQPEERSAVAVDLRGPGLVAQVDPSTRPTGLRAVECLWLNGLSSGSTSVCFSLAGYTPEAHERAEGLGIPLFVLDLTGTPQPVNAPADALIDTGAP